MRAKILFDDVINVISWLKCKIEAKTGFYELTHTLFYQKKMDALLSM